MRELAHSESWILVTLAVSATDAEMRKKIVKKIVRKFVKKFVFLINMILLDLEKRPINRADWKKSDISVYEKAACRA